MIKFDDTAWRQAEEKLRRLNSRGIPFANRNTINEMAFATMRLAKKNVRNDMTLRNKWTERTIIVDRARSLNPNTMQAEVGSTQGYMADQEFGAVHTKKGREGIIIPTAFSAGQKGAQPRTKLPRRGNKFKNINLRGGHQAKLRGKQELIIKVRTAIKTGQRHIFHDFGRKKGIFKVVGGRRGGNRGWPKGARLEMVHDMSKQSVRIPANPWLRPAYEQVKKNATRIHRKHLLKQIKRL